VFACEMLLRSKSKAKNAMAAQAAILHSILLSTFCVLGQFSRGSANAGEKRTFSSAHVHRSLGSKRCRFSYVDKGWKNLARSGSSNTDGCVAMALGSGFGRRRQSDVIAEGGISSTRGAMWWSASRFANVLLSVLSLEGVLVPFSTETMASLSACTMSGNKRCV